MIDLYGISYDDALDLLEEARHTKLVLTGEFDRVHAEFEQLVDTHMPEIDAWITSAAIGRFMAESSDREWVLVMRTVKLPGMWLQIPKTHEAHYDNDGDHLLVDIYQHTNPRHEWLNVSLNATADDIVRRAQLIYDASKAARPISNRLQAAGSLVATLEARLTERVAHG